MAEVALSGVTKSWGATPAVDRVSFSAPPGRLVALLGPSGCGKSTTLRLIAGLEAASAGTIAIGNRDVTGLPPAKRGVSMVFQSYALFPHLSVAENIVFGLKVRDVPRPERDARLKRAAGILGLEKLLERKPSQLSGGQQQRVALGRAIVAETKVCLMDEPLSNLDAQLRVEMRREIRALQRRLGMTMLYVTHDQVEAMTMADQVVLMRNGRIEQDAPPAELYERPASIFTARFVGTPPMNVLPAALVTGCIMMDAARRTFVMTGAPAGRDPATLAVGVRPETVRLGSEGVPATVAAVEYLGADTLIETRVAGEPFLVRSLRSRRRAGRRDGASRLGRRRRAMVRPVVGTSHRLSKKHKARGRTSWTADSFSPAPRRSRPARSQSRRSRQGVTEVSFFYPIAVGGPITKIIDAFAADFEKENPSIKVRPIYAGTYQETIVKALTAHKSGTPPVTSVLLSTDMFTLIDEDAIVPIDGFLKTDDDKKWLASFFPGFMLNSQTARQNLGRAVPALDHRAVLEQGAVPGGRARSREGARHLGRPGRLRREADEARRRRQRLAMGRAGALLGLPLLAVPGLHHAGRRDPHEPGGRPHIL